MPFTRIAIASVVVCLATVSVAQADDWPRRGRGRGHSARVIAHPRVMRPPVVVHRYAGPARYVPFGPRLAYRPVYRPGLGIGIYVGSPYRHGYRSYRGRYYPTPYPVGYAPYGYVSPYAYSYPSYGGIYAVPPPGALYGGVRLDVTPSEAAVYVDGYYAGIVDDFDGALQRVALEPGPHRFEIAAPGYETVSFEVNVRPSETVRYRGDMQPFVP